MWHIPGISRENRKNKLCLKCSQIQHKDFGATLLLFILSLIWNILGKRTFVYFQTGKLLSLGLKSPLLRLPKKKILHKNITRYTVRCILILYQQSTYFSAWENELSVCTVHVLGISIRVHLVTWSWNIIFTRPCKKG